MNTVIIILLVVLAIAVVLLFAICGFLFNQVIWYKPIKLPAAKGEVEDDFAKDHRKAEEEFGKMAAETSPLANAIAKQLETAPQSIDARLRHRTAKKYMRACSCPRRATGA